MHKKFKILLVLSVKFCACVCVFFTLEVRLLAQQVADGGLQLRVLPMTGVDVGLTVGPGENRVMI